MPSKKIRYVSEKKNISCQWAKTDKINQENGKTLPQSYPDIRSERQNRSNKCEEYVIDKKKTEYVGKLQKFWSISTGWKVSSQTE